MPELLIEIDEHYSCCNPKKPHILVRKYEIPLYSKVLSFGGKIEMVFKNNFKNQEINITTFYIYIT